MVPFKQQHDDDEPNFTQKAGIAGSWVPSRASDFLDVHNPALGDVIARTPLSTGEEVDRRPCGGRRRFPAGATRPPPRARG